MTFAELKFNASFENLNLLVPLSQETDKNTIYLRRRLYLIKCETFEKLADFEPDDVVSSVRTIPGLFVDNRLARLTWFKNDYNKIKCDQMPDRLAYAVRLA